LPYFYASAKIFFINILGKCKNTELFFISVLVFDGCKMQSPTLNEEHKAKSAQENFVPNEDIIK
jgi:hypothetical protein